MYVNRMEYQKISNLLNNTINQSSKIEQKTVWR